MAIDKAVDSTQLDADLTSVANAIRTKGGTSAQLAFPAGFVSAIGDIPSGGGIDELFGNGTIQIEDNDITSVKNNPFQSWPTKPGVYLSLPNCETWTGAAFAMGDSASGNVARLHLPALKTCPGAFIRRQGSLTAIYFPALTTLSQECFKELYHLEKDIVLPSLTSGNSVQQFNGIGTNNGGITVNVYMPALTSFNFNNSFQDCKYTKIIDFGNASGNIGSAVFKNCYILDTLIFRKSDGTVNLTTAGSTAFENTPFNGYNSLTGTVYVPSALVSTYKAASNWSVLYNNGTCNFVAIEGSAYENLNYTALAAPAKAVVEDWL